MSKLLTIVVPVYKVEQYINKCLDSCIIYKNDADGSSMLDDELMNLLEVIIVNDGTPDNSAELSREYTIRYPQTFRQIDKENGGHGSAWNVGVKEATGKYLRFLDSDDWLTNLDKLMHKLKDCEADLVFSDYIRFYSAEERYELCQAPTRVSNTTNLTGELLKKFSTGFIGINFWYTTYKTSILKPLLPLFAEHVMYDDSVLSFAPLVYGRTCDSLNIPIYIYLIGRPGQSMQASVQLRNANSYVACLRHEEEMRKRINDVVIPTDLLSCIDQVIEEYAHFVCPHFAHLPYYEAKERMSYVITHYPFKNHQMPRIIKRYIKLPFIAFYVIEKLRSLKNRIN